MEGGGRWRGVCACVCVWGVHKKVKSCSQSCEPKELGARGEGEDYLKDSSVL